jgi:hypothetical protein
MTVGGNTSQLRLVTDETAAAATVPNSAVERIFGHWVFMFGKHAGRTALGPTRRRAIVRALQLYPEGELLLAVEGCAASPFHNGDNDRGQSYTDVTLILRDEEHLERFAALGREARRQALAELARERSTAAAQASAPEVGETPEQAALNRERVRQIAARRSGRVA